MVTQYNQTVVYLNLIRNLTNINMISSSDVNISNLFDYVQPIYEKELDGSYSAPMFSIGLYIAVASLWCVLSILADLVHGFKSNKLWFPCTWFTINSLSLAVIAVAMKLPVDLSGSMPGAVDQVAKLGSMAFMGTMMANLLPCLATMDSKELRSNFGALGVLVITLVINICIQIRTGVIVKYGKEVNEPLKDLESRGNSPRQLRDVANISLENLTNNSKKVEVWILESMSYTTVATFYVVLLLLLLIIYASLSLAILKSKQIMAQKYKEFHKSASEDVQPSTYSNHDAQRTLNVKQLHKLVSNHWIMAGSGSPQLMSACFATTAASGIICFLIFLWHIFTFVYGVQKMGERNFGSDYQASTTVIFIVQSIGILLGTIAPLCRCVVPVLFKVHVKSISKDIKLLFEVEKYWTQKLYDWKNTSISLPFGNHNLKVGIKHLKNLILNICITLQKGVVVVCKIIAFVPEFILYMVCGSEGMPSKNLEQRKYVLQLENEDELGDKTLKRLLESLDQLIQKSEKNQPKNLMKLISEKSTNGFQGVRKYDNNDPNDCWSLPVVTLTTIAVTLPNLDKKEVKSLLQSVREGLHYVTLVEKNLNATEKCIPIQKAAARLWEEVDLRHKWLGIRWKDIATQVNKSTSQEDTTLQVVKLFLEEVKKKNAEGVGCQDELESNFMSICLNSMSGVAETIIREKESNMRLFDELSSRIADIMAACLTNLPEVIAMKCHTNEIEKSESSAEAAAILLGETKQIIDALQGPLRDLSIQEELSSFKNWRAHLSEP